MIDLIYDGYCSFCIKSLQFIKKFDSRQCLRLVDGNDWAYVAAHYPKLKREDLQSAMYGFADGSYYRGYDAFVRAFRAMPSLVIIAAIMAAPPVRWIGLRVYEQVAKNRRSFGCSGGSCSI